MITQAYFEDIQHHIKRELEKAKSSIYIYIYIYIAVAWFRDSELFDILYRVKDLISLQTISYIALVANERQPDKLEVNVGKICLK